MAMTLVSTVTVGSGGAASIEFTNIAQTGKDLLIFISLRASDAGAAFYGTNLGVNGGSIFDFTARRLIGDGSTASSGTGLEFSVNAPNSTSNTFTNASFYIANYTSTTNKSISVDWVAENNATASSQQLIALRTTTTAAITSFKIYDLNFVQHSSVSLYIVS